MKRLALAVATALTVVLGAAPAFGLTVPERARDDRACDQQANSPSCRPDGAGFNPPGLDGIEAQHNETLVRDGA